MADTARALALTFHSTTFDVVDRDGQRWLQAADIARALGYAADDAISRIYRRRADEFTDKMTLTVKSTVKGFGNGNSEKEVRVFSLRGAHLIAMFARTPIAKEFRRWVLDVLDREMAQQRRAGLTKQQASSVRSMIEAAQKQFLGALTKIEKQVTEWELVDDGPPPNPHLRATVKQVERYKNGDWALYVISGMCGFNTLVAKNVMQPGGVKVGDLVRLEYRKGDSPLAGQFTRVSLMDERATSKALM